MEFKKYDFESLNHSAEENLLSYLKEHEELFKIVLWRTEEESVIINGYGKFRYVISINGEIVYPREHIDSWEMRDHFKREDLEKFGVRKNLTPSEFEECLWGTGAYMDFDNYKFFNAVLKYLNSIDSNLVVSLYKKVVEQSITEYEKRKADLVVELGSLQEKKYGFNPYFKSLNRSAEENLLSYLKEHEELYESVLKKTLLERVIIKKSGDFITYKQVLSINGEIVKQLEKEDVYESDLWRKEDLEKYFSSKRLTSSEFEKCLFGINYSFESDSERFFGALLKYLNLIDSNFDFSLHKKVVEQSIVECERKIADLVVKLRGLQKVSDTENGHPGKQGAMKVIVKRRKRLS